MAEESEYGIGCIPVPAGDIDRIHERFNEFLEELVKEGYEPLSIGGVTDTKGLTYMCILYKKERLYRPTTRYLPP